MPPANAARPVDALLLVSVAPVHGAAVIRRVRLVETVDAIAVRVALALITTAATAADAALH